MTLIRMKDLESKLLRARKKSCKDLHIKDVAQIVTTAEKDENEDLFFQTLTFNPEGKYSKQDQKDLLERLQKLQDELREIEFRQDLLMRFPWLTEYLPSLIENIIQKVNLYEIKEIFDHTIFNNCLYIWFVLKDKNQYLTMFKFELPQYTCALPRCKCGLILNPILSDVCLPHIFKPYRTKDGEVYCKTCYDGRVKEFKDQQFQINEYDFEQRFFTQEDLLQVQHDSVSETYRFTDTELYDLDNYKMEDQDYILRNNPRTHILFETQHQESAENLHVKKDWTEVVYLPLLL